MADDNVLHVEMHLETPEDVAYFAAIFNAHAKWRAALSKENN